jgi:hypothetical protein
MDEKFQEDYEQEEYETPREVPEAPSPMSQIDVPKLSLGKEIEFLGTKNLKRETDYLQKEVKFSQHNFEDKFREFEGMLTTIDDAIRNNDSRISEIKKNLDGNIKVPEVVRLASSGDPWFHNYEKLNDIAKSMVENISLRAWQIEIVRILTDHMMKLIEDMRKESRESVVGKYLEGMREKEKKIEDTLSMKMMENFERMMKTEREFNDKRINSLLMDKGVIPKTEDNGQKQEVLVSQKPRVIPADFDTVSKKLYDFINKNQGCNVAKLNGTFRLKGLRDYIEEMVRIGDLTVKEGQHYTKEYQKDE